MTGWIQLLLLAACCHQPAGAPSAQTSLVFLSDVVWNAPPRDLGKSYSEGDGEFAFFHASGEFEFLSVTLFRDLASGSISVCGGCGYSTRKGTWTEMKGMAFQVDSRWTHRHFAPLLGGAEEDRVQESWKIEGRSESGAPTDLSRSGRIFHRLSSIPDAATVAPLLAQD